MNVQAAREKLGQKFANITEVADGVLRGIRRNGDLDLAAYVFDLNNRVPTTVGDLSDYLDLVMGATYFDKSNSANLRWNNYLYFVVDKDIADSPALKIAKRNLEADRSYARKFVIADEDLDQTLDGIDSVAVADSGTDAIDVVQGWSEGLSAVGFESVLDSERPIADVVRGISSGTSKHTVRTKKSTGVETSQKLAESHLRSIKLSGFRSYPKEKTQGPFVKANLLFGSNGVGKTSLLEGIEYLYCGANRRSVAPGGTTVEGVLASGHSVTSSWQQLLSDSKTRQRMWYGGDDNSRQNQLPSQFARFNFMNTDAAAELSLFKDGSIESSARILATLLSGYEATEMWQRILDVRKAVAEEIRAKRSERAFAESNQKGKEQERLAIEALPGQTDAAFSVFNEDLKRIGWRDTPESKKAVTEALVETLSDLTSQLSATLLVDWLGSPLTALAIADEATKLLVASDEIKVIFSRAEEDTRLRAHLKHMLGVAEVRKTELARIPQSALTELEDLSANLIQANDVLVQNAQAFAALPTDIPPESWQSSKGGEFVGVAYSLATATHRETSDQLEKTKHQFAKLTSTQSQLQTALDELHAWAVKVVEHRHTDVQCPVCGSEFMPGDLFKRMRSLSLLLPDDATSGLRLRIDELSAQLEVSLNDVSWLAQLDRFVRATTEPYATVTVRQALLAISTYVERRQVAVDMRDVSQAGLDSYARAGLTIDIVRRLCVPLDEQIAPESLDVGGSLERAQQVYQRVEREIAELDARGRARDMNVRILLNTVNIASSESLNLDVENLVARQRVAQRASEACTFASQYLDLSSVTDLDSLYTSLDLSVLGAKKVLASLQADSKSESRVTDLIAQISQISERLVRNGESIDRLNGAQRVLDDLIENQSLDSASAAVVEATHKVADIIFGRIHSPAEYLVTAEADTPLRRRDNNSGVRLDQVSTGQRAAYALAMFLAMNAQVKSGPKVILLDDPISHIDDLNALSFLDYLRNLVLKSDRQVFFATADEKIAGLFVHKFGFLGSDFQTFELDRG